MASIPVPDRPYQVLSVGPPTDQKSSTEPSSTCPYCEGRGRIPLRGRWQVWVDYPSLSQLHITTSSMSEALEEMRRHAARFPQLRNLLRLAVVYD